MDTPPALPARRWLPVVAMGLAAVPMMAADLNTDGSLADVQAKVRAASVGDVVRIPAGTFTWGAGGTALEMNKAVILQGAGPTRTTINLAPTGPTWAKGVIRISAGGIARDLAVNGTDQPVAAFACTGTDGWRITNVKYVGGSHEAYFAYADTYGLIDTCDITGGTGSSELIFTRGPTDSWQTPSSLGTANAVYIEDCTFRNTGYVCDANANSRMVVRFCTIDGSSKVDAHGKSSNTPPRSARHMEVYNNTWTSDGYWTAMELRGGTGMVFDNANTAGDSTWLILTDYYLMNNGYGSAKYPIDDQIGVGMDPKAAHSEPYYLWGNRVKGGGNWTAVRSAYGHDLGGVIDPDRDYFEESGSFTGAGGMGRGTKAKMQAVHPKRTGVGFWVIDEGSWRSGFPNSSGRLYAWNGSAWVLKYTPFTYPHPLRGGGQQRRPGAKR